MYNLTLCDWILRKYFLITEHQEGITLDNNLISRMFPFSGDSYKLENYSEGNYNPVGFSQHLTNAKYLQRIYYLNFMWMVTFLELNSAEACTLGIVDKRRNFQFSSF